MDIPVRLSKSLDRLGLSRETGIRKKLNQQLASLRNEQRLRSVEPAKSFSQLGEDAILQAYLPADLGFYVDVGSGSPVAGSNTYALYLRGWRGILVDPIASNIELSRKIRPEDQCILTLCGEFSEQTLDFFEFETYQYSTTLAGRAQEMQNLGHTVRAVYQLQTTRLSELLPNKLPSGPTVLSIDAEGVELEILRGNDWDHFTPEFIIVEEWEPPIRKETPISTFLEAKGYRLLGFSGVSCLYRLNG